MTLCATTASVGVTTTPRLADTWQTATSHSPASGQGSELTDVYCQSGSSCLLVGNQTNGRSFSEIERRGAWTRVVLPAPRGATRFFDESLDQLSCRSLTWCEAVGEINGPSTQRCPCGRTIAENWNGHTWTAQELPHLSDYTHAKMYDLSCSSVRWCVAVGIYEVTTHQERSFAYWWNGSSWHHMTVPMATKQFVNSVVCFSSTNCLGVGTEHFHLDIRPLAEKWNGYRWQVVAMTQPLSNSNLERMACSSSTSCHALGTTNSRMLSETWNGVRWTIDPATSPSAIAPDFADVVCPRANFCLGVGWAGATSHVVPTSVSWNSNQWRALLPPSGAHSNNDVIFAVSCPTAHYCQAVGETNPYERLRILVERFTH